MESIIINLGGEDYSIQYYYDIDDDLEIDSIQNLHGFEMINILNQETYDEIKEKILNYGLK